jgi:hypothetical protein
MLSSALIRKLSLSGLLVITLTACGPTKVQQCNKIAEITKKGEQAVKTFEQDARNLGASFEAAGKKQDFKAFRETATKSSKTINSVATDLDKVAQDLGGLDLKDETLSQLRSRYANNVKNGTGLFRQMAGALDKLSRIEINPQGLQGLQQVAQEIDGLSGKLNTVVTEGNKVTNELNTYCRQ